MRYHIFLILLPCFVNGWAQDTLVLPSGREMSVKITQIRSSDLGFYKLRKDPDTISHFVELRKIVMVKYADGRRFIIVNTSNEVGKRRARNCCYRLDEQVNHPVEFRQIVYDSLIRLYHKRHFISIVLGCSGAVFGVGGLACQATIVPNRSVNYSGFGLIGAGLCLIAAGIIEASLASRCRKLTSRYRYGFAYLSWPQPDIFLPTAQNKFQGDSGIKTGITF